MCSVQIKQTKQTQYTYYIHCIHIGTPRYRNCLAPTTPAQSGYSVYLLYWHKSTNTDANFAQWASDCYFGASALALQRLLAHFRYTLVAEDGKGTTLFFVRNDLLPAGGDKGGPAAGLACSVYLLYWYKSTNMLTPAEPWE